MEATINLNHKLEYEAFSRFCAEMAGICETVDADNARRYDPFFGDRAPDPVPTPAAGTAEATPASPKSRARKKAEAEPETKGNISTDPENRIDPDSPETEARDKADEAAELAAKETKAPAAPLTHEDVRAALARYITKFGMKAAETDGQFVLAKVCGEGIKKVSAIPDDKIAAVVAGLDEMTEKNPFGHEAVA